MTNIITPLFHDQTLLDQALQLPLGKHKAGYERLEFLGDRVLGLVVSELLFESFPKEQEGDLSKRFVALVCEKALANVARQIGIPPLLKTNENKLRQNDSVLSDVCEAVLGALYLDAGLEAVKHFMIPIWQPLVQSEPSAPQDPKSAVQEWSQKYHKILPAYTLIDKQGQDHSPIFTVRLTIGDHSVTSRGASKKAAEQAAAQTFLKRYVHGHK